MMLIRPIRAADLDALFQLAKGAGVGVTTLPANAELLAERILISERSFQQAIPRERANYLFALEDSQQGRIVGVSAIEASVGAHDVWYNYRLSTCVNASREIGVHTTNQTLHLTNDLTGCSEVCSLFLNADYRYGSHGRLLSKCRFLFMREHMHLFSDKVIAEMRGYSDAQGRSPFWDALGRKFFGMDFSRADYLSGLGNKSFVAELMPKYPIYLAFLDAEARAAVGQVHDNTRPALRMLQNEGFNFNGFVDIFDAGPIVESFTANVRAVRESRLCRVSIEDAREQDQSTPAFVVSNTALADFRACMLPASALSLSAPVRDDELVAPDVCRLTPQQADCLQVADGDWLRCIPLRYQENGE